MTVRALDGRVVGAVLYKPFRTTRMGRYEQLAKKAPYLAVNQGPDDLHTWRCATEAEALHELMAYDLERGE